VYSAEPVLVFESPVPNRKLYETPLIAVAVNLTNPEPSPLELSAFEPVISIDKRKLEGIISVGGSTGSGPTPSSDIPPEHDIKIIIKKK